VHPAQVYHEFPIDEDPYVVVAAEVESFTPGVLEGNHDLGGEVEVVELPRVVVLSATAFHIGTPQPIQREVC
jgi:hypothetical protein